MKRQIQRVLAFVQGVALVLLLIGGGIVAVSSLDLHPRYRLVSVKNNSNLDLILVDKQSAADSYRSVVWKNTRVRGTEIYRVGEPSTINRPFHSMIGGVRSVANGWGWVTHLYTQPSTILLFVVLPCLVVILLQLYRLSLNV